LQDMLDIAESVLITLRQQRVSGNPGGQIVVDPVPVAPPAIVDPSGTGPGSDPVE